MDMQLRNTVDVRKLKLKELIDRLGAAKSVLADTRTAHDALRDEIVRRFQDKATLDNTVVREGQLYRTTITYSEATRLNGDKIREELLTTKSLLKKYTFITTQYVVKVVAKTGKKDT